MTQQLSIEEGNKLIAEFMGWHQDSQGFWIGCPEAPHFKLTFDKSWNELMLVVQKIEKYARIEIASNQICIWYKYEDELKHPDGFYCSIPIGKMGDKILTTWNAVVQFILWYNTQPKPLTT